MKSKPIKGATSLEFDWSKEVHLHHDSPFSTTINRGLIIQKRDPQNSNKQQEKARGSNAAISLKSSSIQIKFIKIQDQDRNIQEQAQKPLNSSTSQDQVPQINKSSSNSRSSFKPLNLYLKRRIRGFIEIVTLTY